MTRPLRVCHVMSADLWAGAEVQVATAASYLAARPDLRLTAVVFNDGWLASELRRLGLEVAVVDERLGTVRMIPAITRFLLAHDVDIVHTHRPNDNVIGTIAATFAGVPHVVRTIHGLPEPMRGWDRAKYRVHDAIDRAALRTCADRVVAVSRHAADALAAAGMRRRAIAQIHNGIDLDRVCAVRPAGEVRRAFGIADDALVIGTAGRLTAVKGQAYLIDAAARILARQPDAWFVLVGAGPLRAELAARARSAGVDARVLFVDPLADVRATVFDLIAALDIFVLPSLSEGSPMALLEAMALGRPVVAAAVGGVPEIVDDGENGVLIPARSAQAIADACLDLARDRRRTVQLGAAARAAVAARFSRERNGEALAALYHSVARPRARRVNVAALLAAPLRKAASRAGLYARYAVEWRRVTRTRRRPAQLAALLQSAQRILVVCHGNIIRSPFAARLISQAIGGRRPLSIASAGLDAEPGRPPHPTAVRTAAPLRVDLTGHTASRVAADGVALADAIFVMDVPQLVAMRRRFPTARHKTFLLTCLAAGGSLDVRDPVDGDAGVFEACYAHIVRAVGPIVHALAGTAE
jgi:glycosyltransferase involved in cell wall biosynthesis/protein-tyrosine-phosphatase